MLLIRLPSVRFSACCPMIWPCAFLRLEPFPSEWRQPVWPRTSHVERCRATQRRKSLGGGRIRSLWQVKHEKVWFIPIFRPCESRPVFQVLVWVLSTAAAEYRNNPSLHLSSCYQCYARLCTGGLSYIHRNNKKAPLGAEESDRGIGLAWDWQFLPINQCVTM